VDVGVLGTSIDTSDPRFGALSDDQRILVQRAVMALETEQGSLDGFPEYGFDIEGRLLEGLDTDELALFPLEVRAALEQEPAFAAVTVEVVSQQDTADGGTSLELRIEITPVTGDAVDFTVSASGNGVSISAVGGA